jgi:predicted Rossmann fold flavoprotein
LELKSNSGTKTMLNINEFNFPKRLWEYLVLSAGIQKGQQWAQLSKIQLVNLANQLNDTRIQISGKSTFKEEFVSAGGVDLSSVNFKTMESKIHSGLYFAGEVLNIDAITGGYNFQNAWTTSYIASSALSIGK